VARLRAGLLSLRLATARRSQIQIHKKSWKNFRGFIHILALFALFLIQEYNASKVKFMPEQEWLKKEIGEQFDQGKPLNNLDWDDFGFASAPEGWEGKTFRIVPVGLSGGGGDLMLFKHTPCGQIWRFAAGFVGPRAIKNVLVEHPKSCTPP
jgi:hypothetical protein